MDSKRPNNHSPDFANQQLRSNSFSYGTMDDGEIRRKEQKDPDLVDELEHGITQFLIKEKDIRDSRGTRTPSSARSATSSVADIHDLVDKPGTVVEMVSFEDEGTVRNNLLIVSNALTLSQKLK